MASPPIRPAPKLAASPDALQDKLRALETQLVYANGRAYDNDFMVRRVGREDVERLTKQIASLKKRLGQ